MGKTSNKSSLKFASALSTEGDWSAAVAEVCDAAIGDLQATPDLAVLFASGQNPADADAIAKAVCERIGCERLMGCTAESVAGVGREVEMEPALSLWLARLPDVRLLPMHLSYERTPDGGTIIGWPDELISGWPDDATMLIFGDPFTFPADLLLERVNDEHAGVPVIGGMASAASQPGDNRLFFGPRALDEGAVAVLISGHVRVRTIVSQGCRPIGSAMVVTKAERNMIQELGGWPALVQANSLFETLPNREQEMVRRGLHVGRVVSEYQEHRSQGDFLVRNVIGADPDSGAIAIGDYVRVGQTIQFHVRDAETADAELRQLLNAAGHSDAARAGGALLFTCNGRGTRLFPEPHHDAGAIKAALGEIPVAGFFAAGEIGPVAGQNFMHGFTASIAVFEEK